MMILRIQQRTKDEPVTLSELANLAEILGTTLVVVSLIYVAIQIRQNTHATRLGAAQNVTRDLRGVTADIHRDSEFAKLYLQGMKNVSALTDDEKFRLYVFILDYLRAFENAYYQHRQGAIDQYVWDALTANLKHTKETSSHKAFWADRSQMFSGEFRDYYDSISAPDAEVAVAPYKSHHSG